MSKYTLQACEKLISKYVNELNGNCITIAEGSLGLGTVLLYGAAGKKSVLIQEFFISAWSSGHKVRMYNKLPKKYQKLINNY